jgi:hypothetical protein
VDDKMLARVRALLAKAEATEFPDEAEALNVKAAELMAAYGIDEALAAAREPGRDAATDKRIVIDPPFAMGKCGLFTAVAAPLRCEAIRIDTRLYDGKNRYRHTMHIFGFRSDIERAELLYTSLLLQAANALQHVPAPRGNTGAAFRDSWLSGFSAAVYWRLLAAENKAADQAQSGRSDGMSVELVLADRSALIGQAYRDAYPDARVGRARKLSGNGTHAGWQVGQRADLGISRNVDRGSGGSLAGTS